MKWVQRNEDKPHRCPECHAVATWGRYVNGPRTIRRCPRDCGVQWRMGSRSSRSEKRSMKLFLRKMRELDREMPEMDLTSET